MCPNCPATKSASDVGLLGRQMQLSAKKNPLTFDAWFGCVMMLENREKQVDVYLQLGTSTGENLQLMYFQ